MNLTPEVIKVFRDGLVNPKPNYPFPAFHDCFKKSETVTAKDVLYDQYMKLIGRDIHKLIVYIIMDQELGQCNGKDERGRLGYYLQINSPEPENESTAA